MDIEYCIIDSQQNILIDLLWRTIWGVSVDLLASSNVGVFPFATLSCSIC